jgi:hypothetical protein
MSEAETLRVIVQEQSERPRTDDLRLADRVEVRLA